MIRLRLLLGLGAVALLLLNIRCDKDRFLPDDAAMQQTQMKPTDLKKPDGESVGNNLSYPVIWSDGYTLNLRGTQGVVTTNGAWYYVWGDDPIDPQAPLNSCLPNPADPDLCLDGSTPGDGGELWKAYVQKDPLNEWQAWNYLGGADPVWVIDYLDWGDNLESVDWTIASQVRTEVVLYEDITTFLPDVTQYAMRHAFGWGINEVHGLQTDLNDNLIDVEETMATVFSPNARLTIQKLNVESREDIPPNTELTWDPEYGWTGDNGLFNTPIFNMAVYEGGDGPGYYSAEVNVKGKVIYGYTWNVRKMNDGVGYYRITFSFDETGGYVDLNTEINETTEIMIPVEEVTEAIALLAEDEGGDTGGATGYIDGINKLTYMDVLITDKQKGAGGGNGGGKVNNPGDGAGGGKDDNLGGTGGNGNGGSGSGSGYGKNN